MSQQSPSPRERAAEFSRWLERLLRAAENPNAPQFAGENTRGVLAALRSGLNGERGRLWPYVGPFLLEHPRESDQWFFAVGALAGWHPKARSPKEPHESLGKTMLRLGEKDGAGRAKPDNSNSLSVRFAALLACHENDLEGHLRQIVGLLRAGDVAVDYHQLLDDLIYLGWHHPDRRLQQKWARDFYRAPRQDEPDNEDSAETSADSANSQL